MRLLDCNNLEQVMAFYGGATGAKIGVRYNGKIYMLKCQQSLRMKNLKNVEISYANDCVSEYIGSHIYKILGIPVHETILGDYHGKLCVLCEDKAYPDKIVEFREIRNSLINDGDIQPSSGMSTNIEDILYVINKAKYIDREEVLRRFWTMFVIDTLIGNCDRNNGNWGFIKSGESLSLYQVYDNGGCLNNKRSDKQMLNDINNCKVKGLAINYVFNYVLNDKRINPFHYLRDYSNPYTKDALKLVTNIDINKVNELLYSVEPIISDVRFKFYRQLLNYRLDELAKLLV
jgi:hypothetical protein